MPTAAFIPQLFRELHQLLEATLSDVTAEQAHEVPRGTTSLTADCTGAVRLRNPPVRGRGRGPPGPGAAPRGTDAAGEPT
jgi:hypothetical protein